MSKEIDGSKTFTFKSEGSVVLFFKEASCYQTAYPLPGWKTCRFSHTQVSGKTWYPFSLSQKSDTVHFLSDLQQLRSTKSPPLLVMSMERDSWKRQDSLLSKGWPSLTRLCSPPELLRHSGLSHVLGSAQRCLYTGCFFPTSLLCSPVFRITLSDFSFDPTFFQSCVEHVTLIG